MTSTTTPDLRARLAECDAFAARWRPRLPILAKTTYLVTHSLGAMPLAAREKLLAYTEQWATRGVRSWGEGWWDAPVSVGNTLGRILNAEPDSVAMQTNVSLIEGIVATALDFSGPRNKVVYTDQNFPTNMYAWEGWKRYGARIEMVPSDPGGVVPTERLLAAIDERTAIVPISHVLFRTSRVQDAKAVCAKARSVGALVLLDTYQSLGTLPVDVRELGADMVTGGSVKWLCGGPGACYLYVRPELQDKLEPLITGWAGHAAPFAFELGAQRYAKGIRRFLNGSPAVPSLLQASAGYEMVLEVGVDAIRRHSVTLTESLRHALADKGFESGSPVDPAQRGGSLTVRLRADEHGPSFVAALEQRGILVDHRPEAGLRVSPHFYTTWSELDAFVAALVELRESGKWNQATAAKGY